MTESIKCLVWDLDRTLWSGTLIEGDACRLRPGIRQILNELDRRGILLSIASANDEDLALARLDRSGIRDLFLHPQINWSNKVNSIRTIAERLNITLATIGFVDDEPYEREQVRHLLPEVRTYDAREYRSLLDRPEFMMRFRTRESRMRRQMYLQEKARAETTGQASRTHRSFLHSCRTEMTLRAATGADLPRILELMHRTHQLNATGIIYTEDEIASFVHDRGHRVFVAELKDRFVDYGRIGVATCRCGPRAWTLLSFFLSCRVMGRGVGNVFLNWIQVQAHRSGAQRLEARYIKRERNRRMAMLFGLAGFEPLKTDADGATLLVKKPVAVLTRPAWLSIREREAA
jgi:FkbH-like protein